jgi:hypothetical protein
LGKEDFILLPWPAASIIDAIDSIALSYQTHFLENPRK